jgi:hypothetical protein
MSECKEDVSEEAFGPGEIFRAGRARHPPKRVSQRWTWDQKLPRTRQRGVGAPMKF